MGKRSLLLVLAYLVLVLLLSACLQRPPSLRTVITIEGTPSIAIETPTPMATPDSDLAYWQNSSKVGAALSIDYDMTSIAYIRGKDVDKFLNFNNNFQKIFCTTIVMVTGAGEKQLRARAVPLQIPIIGGGLQERLFRVDFGDKENNKNVCGGTLGEVSDSSGAVVFLPADVCPGCTQDVRSGGNGVRIYYAEGKTEVGSSELSLSILSLQINIISRSTDGIGACDEAGCLAKGYDCCLVGQCVKDGMMRANAIIHPDYAQAKAEVDQNPINYSKWPEVYYVCPGKALPTPMPTTIEDPVAKAKVRVEYLKEMFYCDEFARADPPVYKYCQSYFNDDSFQEVKNRIWRLCECATVGTPAPADPSRTCPTYGLVLYDSAGKALEGTPEAKHLFGKDLTINNSKMSDNEIFIRGPSINNFLKQNDNLNKKYCLVLNFDTATIGVSKRQLRVTANPIAQIHFLSKEIERMLKINFLDYQHSRLNCYGSAYNIDATPISSSDDIAFSSENICSGNCNSILSALYTVSASSGIAEATKVTDPSVSVLKLLLDGSSNPTLSNALGGYYWFLKQEDTVADVRCQAEPDPNPTPFQILQLRVNTRSAPHRFFKAVDGTSVDDIKIFYGTPEMSNGTPLALSEGTPFYYNDEFHKVAAQNVNNNFNAVIGQMKVDLTRALPAKMVAVEVGRVYIISTISGNYTPCPMCTRDKWFNAFSAFPSSQMGVGVVAQGHTTSRDTGEDNLSYGNYEDTSWGRLCWIPPTMIPFTHKQANDIQTQRGTRLAAQAALYANGYQHDWFGFNQGALIGSFNGVNWFAIGNNRRVKATSRKLFLAMNAPFADLANAGELQVQIIADDGAISTAASFDYNFDITNADNPNQNQAGSCQQYYKCETDTDCISKLGWEYMCAKVSSLKTLWPDFDRDGKEITGDGKALSGGYYKTVVFDPDRSIPTSWKNQKRCSYRGMGAACAVDYSKIADLNLRKLFACAPNFYCASVSNSNFSDSMNREADNVLGIVFGQGANILGRASKYVAGTGSLTTFNSNFIANAEIQNENFVSTSLGQMGFCRPGKSLTMSGVLADPVKNHQARDSYSRSDYISQIGSCASNIYTQTLLGLKRVHSCPVLNDNSDDKDNFGNYYYTYMATPAYGTPEAKKAIAQNACGAESLYTGNKNVFAAIEGEPLSSIFYLDREGGMLAKDACFRRAGSLCHSDLDCSPNRLHAEESRLYDRNYFGDTLAEKQYWEEYLICGQPHLKVWKSDQDPESVKLYNSFSFKENRCCRASGETITMYTKGFFDPEAGVTERALNSKLQTEPTAFAVVNPIGIGRYSRYTIMENLTIVDLIAGSPDIYPTQTYTGITPAPASPMIIFTPAEVVAGVPGSVMPKPYQWKSINDTGGKTCCSGWVRAFADESHEWNNYHTRLKLNPQNFQCINYRNPIMDSDYKSDRISDSVWNQERSLYCRDRMNYGCIHYMQGKKGDIDADRVGLGQSSGKIFFPMAIETEWTEQWSKRTRDAGFLYVHSDKRKGYLHDMAPYAPVGVDGGRLTAMIASGALSESMVRCLSVDGGASNAPRAVMSSVCTVMVVQIPSYMNGGVNIDSVWLSRRSSDGKKYEGFNEDGETLPQPMLINPFPAGKQCNMNGAVPELFIGGTTYPDCLLDNSCTGDDVSGWCYDKQANGDAFLYIRRHYCHAIVDNATEFDAGFDKRNTRCASSWWNKEALADYTALAGIIIKFRPQGLAGHDYGTLAGGVNPQPIIPGSDSYYLEKLSRLELLGIPQIYYEPIYCSYDKQKLMPGIFKDTLESSSDFEGKAFSATRNHGTLSTDDVTNPNRKIVFKDMIGSQHDDVFSPHTFFCCQRTNSIVDDYRKCCSGFAVAIPGSESSRRLQCKLPRNTDLNLYFNRFVSGEASYSELDKGLRLEDRDFDPYTGYPITANVKVWNKLVALGEAYCSDQKVVTGAAFGNFGPRPATMEFPDNSQLTRRIPYGILYRTTGTDLEGPGDVEQVATPLAGSSSTEGNRGVNRFLMQGRRWNNHLYCGSN
ncbi:MAG: hypothetical protein HQK52_03005 [Oligoflexia bacterium]|nr:hypothetical protein [Oligoflexia bacterium]